MRESRPAHFELKENNMAGREKHKQRSCRNYNRNLGSFASHARSTAGKAAYKEQKKNIFEGIKNAFSKMFKKNKEG